MTDPIPRDPITLPPPQNPAEVPPPPATLPPEPRWPPRGDEIISPPTDKDTEPEKPI
jgi:hypothetical protein